jgi:hypothetical protein|tara:strand:+ start:677 stop:913 length:237 start_codon:yes stop_codon:yes gene_type:complete
MCDKCAKQIEDWYHMNCGENNTECPCHDNNPNEVEGTVPSLWGNENETFSHFTPKMLRSIVRDTTEADIQSDHDLANN